jgi:uncharacterized protein YjiS (DUF1127 family)
MRDYIFSQARMREQTFAFPKLRRLLRNWQARRQIRRLTELDDHVLRDIGFSREELRQALRLPHDMDPLLTLLDSRIGTRPPVARRGR